MWGRAADGRRSRSPRSKSTLFIVYHNKSFLARATAQLLVWGACPTFHAPAASSRPLSLVLTSKSLGPVTSSVALNPLILVSLIHLLLRLQLQQPAARPSASRSLPEPVSGYTTQACCCDNNSPLGSSTLLGPPPPLSPSPSPPPPIGHCLGDQTRVTDPIWIIDGPVSIGFAYCIVQNV